MNYLGDYAVGATVYVPFATYASTGASVTITGLATTDIEIYKNGSATQRASEAGYTLLDTDGIDFDGITGIHGFSIDLSDNTDAGFFAAGADYWVVVASVTCDGQTVNAVVATFSIENRSVGKSAATAPSVNVASISGDTTAADNLEAACDGGSYNVGGGAVVAASVTGAVGSVTGAVGSVTGNVGGNVAGSVASVSGAVGSVTGNVGGNVAGSVASVVGAVGSVTGAVGSMADAGASLSAIPWNAAWDAEVESEVDDALGGGTGTALTAVPWNAAWDAEVQSECADALAAYDPPTNAEMEARTIAAASYFDPAADTVDVGKINGSANAAARLALSAAQIIPGTVNDDNTAPSTTVFAASDITEATADHYIGRLVLWTTGDLAGQVTDVTAYELDTGEGKFTVTAMTEAPADGDTFVLV